MQYVNNWIAQLSAEFGPGATVVPLPGAALSRLSPGQYLLTLVNSANSVEQTAWEVLLVTVAPGIATATRAQEGTAAQRWPAGSLIYCSITAGAMTQLNTTIANLLQRVVALEKGGGGVDPPTPGPDGAMVDAQGNTLVDDQGNALTGE